MRSRRQKWVKRLGILATGVVFVNLGDCLPKDYFYNFAGAGRASILSAFAQTVFTTITDTLFPLTADNTTDGGTTSGG